MHEVTRLFFFLTAGLLILLTAWPVWLRFGLCLVCALCPTLSFASGLLVWLVILPVIWWCAPMPSIQARMRVTGAWLLAFAVTMALYFHNLKNEVGSDYAMGQGPGSTLGRDIAAFAADPLKAVFYTARLLGNPLMRGNTADLMESSLRMGLALLALYALCLGWWLWRFRDMELRRRLLPWLAVGGYAIGSAMAITMGRVWLGVTGAYALTTRYVIHATPLLVALPVLVWLIAEDSAYRFPRVVPLLPRVLTGAGVAFAMLGLTAWTYGERMMETWSSSRKRGASGTMFFKTGCQVENDYPDHPSSDCLLADDLHVLRPPMLKNRRLDNLRIYPQPLNERFAVWSSLRFEKKGDELHGVADGRAILKKHWRVADAVVLAYEAADGDWEIFHVANVTGLPLFLNGVIVRDLEFVHQPTERLEEDLSRFNADFRLSELPKGTWKVAAWAYDYDERHLSLIPGSFEIDTVGGSVRPLGNDPSAVHLKEFVETLKKARK